MGGSKGLNILPKKSFHVYNRENKLKVSRDEAAHAEHHHQLAEKQLQAEREQRLNKLKERARQRHGGVASFHLNDGHTHVEPEHDHATASYKKTDDDPMVLLEKKETTTKKRPRSSLLTPTPTPTITANDTTIEPKQPVLPPVHLNTHGHVHLFAQEELQYQQQNKARHPDNTEASRQTIKSRGDPLTQTSDPRFDESFQLGYRGKDADKAWYLQERQKEQSSDDKKDTEKGKDTNEDRKKKMRMMEGWMKKAEEALQQQGNEKEDDEEEFEGLRGVKIMKKKSNNSSEEVEERDKRVKDNKTKTKKKKREKGKKGEEMDKDRWARMREERLLREQKERERERMAVRSALALGGLQARRRAHGPEEVVSRPRVEENKERRYNSGYGYGR